MKNIILISILFLFFVIPNHGQIIVNDQNTVNLAHSYYRNSEFEKAAPMFLDLYEKTKAAHYFEYYINCLVSLQQYDTAEKAMKQLMRNDKNPVNLITLGYIYKAKNDINNSKKTFDEVIEKLQPNMGTIITVANTFFNRGEFDYAEKSYLKGRQLIPGEMFRNYLATVYAYLRNYDKMMVEYMALLNEDEKSLANVQARLNSLMRYDFDNTLRNLVKKEVIRSIQTAPSVLVFNRLLIWIFVQEENFTQALNQSIALDRRTRTEETNILTFAKSASDQSLYEIALGGINYLLERKPDVANLNDVKQEKVRIEYLKLIHTSINDTTAQATMESTFESFFKGFGYNTRTAPLARDYAHYMAFFRNNTDKAFEILDNAMKSKDMDANQYTMLRIELADLNVYANYLWEASLQYSQIIEANKNNPLGDEVKMKRAQLSYFQGEIEWAKVQLDVLKASTSKLIANDAMELSLLIASNYELDSITEPIQMFGRADLYLFRNQNNLAYTILDSIIQKFPGHTLNDQILMRKALISERRFDYVAASQYYSKIVEDYGFSIIADDALFKLAQITEKKLADNEKAKTYYKQILLSYPGSIYVADAREKFREIRGDFKINDPFDLLNNPARATMPE
jgi:tetratricopeptide (TPR) repeat protein